MLRKSNSKLLLLLLVPAIPLAAQAATIKVPLNKPTIQAAIDSAAAGDTVQVSPGTYYEKIDFHGKAITVTAVRSPRQTIIDGKSKGPVVTFASGEVASSVLSGFVIQHGSGNFNFPCNDEGGGICVENSSPTIQFNTIKNNTACTGAGIGIGFGSPLLSENLISNNVQGGCSGGIGGGGISVRGASSVRILNNIIENNMMSSADGGGISLFAAGTPTINGNIIRGNTATGISPCANGGGISMENQSDASIGQNLITGNTAGCGGGVYMGVPSGDRGPFLVNNTISTNSGAGVYSDGFPDTSKLINNIIVAAGGQNALYCDGLRDTHPPVIQFDDIYNQSGGAYGGVCVDQTGVSGNISADPLFKSVASQNYHLLAGSPAIDAGSNTAANIATTDFDGAARIQDGNGDSIARADMGVDEFTSSVATADLATMDDGGHRSAAAVVAQGRPSTRFQKVDTDHHRTVFSYDAAGNLMTETDTHGVKHKLK